MLLSPTVPWVTAGPTATVCPPQTVTTWTIGGVPTPVRVRIIDADGRALYFSKIFADLYRRLTTSTENQESRTDSSFNLQGGQYILRKKDTNLTYTFDPTNVEGSSPSTDTNGNTLTLTYTGSQLMQVTNNFGAALTFVYTGTHISSVTDPKGQSISYTYTGSDNLTRVTYPDTNSVSYVYDTSHRLTDKKDTSSNVIGHWDYNADGRVSNYYRYLKDGVPQEKIDFTYNLTTVPNTTTLTNPQEQRPIQQRSTTVSG